jgi:hypothetical protein
MTVDPALRGVILRRPVKPAVSKDAPRSCVLRNALLLEHSSA